MDDVIGRLRYAMDKFEVLTGLRAHSIKVARDVFEAYLNFFRRECGPVHPSTSCAVFNGLGVKPDDTLAPGVILPDSPELFEWERCQKAIRDYAMFQPWTPSPFAGRSISEMLPCKNIKEHAAGCECGRL